MWNPLADRDFCFYDQSLLEAVMVGEPAVHEFFRVLSLCHTVMSEEKSEGKDLEQSLRIDYLPYSESHFIQWKSLNKVYLRKLLTLILLEGNYIVILDCNTIILSDYLSFFLLSSLLVVSVFHFLKESCCIRLSLQMRGRW